MRRLLECWLPASRRFQSTTLDPADTEALKCLCLSPENRALLGMLRPLLANINEDALMLLKDGPMLSGMQKLCQSQSNSQEDIVLGIILWPAV